MHRYIDADALIKECCGDCKFKRCEYCDDAWMVDKINQSPTIDAVEVVRCKDCKWCNEYGVMSRRLECRRFLGSLQVREDDFCSYGKRKEGANNV